jgi:ATP-dependent RNA helicase RhlE
MTDFVQLGLGAPILKALDSEGYATPTPIQAQVIPHGLAGRDVLGIAQTGTGKTAAFALPMLERLAAHPERAPKGSCRALVLAPTRELAAQIAESFRVYGRNLRMSVAAIFGGVGMGGQIQRLAGGVDIVVATPGRLLDHLQQRTLRLDAVRIFALDEADRMLDMGFVRDIRRIVPYLPRERQSLFFSATMPSDIGALAGELLKDPVKVEVAPVATTAEKIDQCIIHVDVADKRSVLVELLRSEAKGLTLVFTRTKHGADKVARFVETAGIRVGVIHGNKSQGQRERALADFRSGRGRVLIATDIAARGIDVDGIGHVINFDLPNVPESYVHRIGRTARAGADGRAISLCAGDERAYLRDIERLIRMNIPATDRRPTQASDRHRSSDPRSQACPEKHRAHRSNRPWNRRDNGRHGSAPGRAPAGSGAGLAQVGFLAQRS